MNSEIIIYYKREKPPNKCECPACKQIFSPQKKIFFPREIWHPRRTYDFFRGYKCTKCGYLMTTQQVDENRNF